MVEGDTALIWLTFFIGIGLGAYFAAAIKYDLKKAKIIKEYKKSLTSVPSDHQVFVDRQFLTIKQLKQEYIKTKEKVRRKETQIEKLSNKIDYLSASHVLEIPDFPTNVDIDILDHLLTQNVYTINRVSKNTIEADLFQMHYLRVQLDRLQVIFEYYLPIRTPFEFHLINRTLPESKQLPNYFDKFYKLDSTNLRVEQFLQDTYLITILRKRANIIHSIQVSGVAVNLRIIISNTYEGCESILQLGRDMMDLLTAPGLFERIINQSEFQCKACNSKISMEGEECPICGEPTSRCVVCYRDPEPGDSMLYLVCCGGYGHVKGLQEWFFDRTTCPSCGTKNPKIYRVIS